jgi:hypothetical protein
LASQPTLSRFENAFDRADVYRTSVALADTVIERHRRRLKRKAKRITINLDPCLRCNDWQIIARSLGAAPHSPVGPQPRFLDCPLSNSGRTPVAEITRRPSTAVDNRSPTYVPPAKSPPRIDIRPRHRQTCTHGHEHPFLHA